MSEKARVLITVKAAPEPSTTYLETVCVAGIRLDVDPPQWIRLYPVPYRLLEGPNKFTKFDVVELDINPAPHDPRAESRRPVVTTIAPQRKPWSIPARGALLEPMVQTMCALRAGVEANINGPSLGLVRPLKVRGLIITKHEGWTEKQSTAMRNFLSQPDLLAGPVTIAALEPPRFEVRYHYWCEEPGCRGHKQRILDWELVAFERRLKGKSDDDAKEAITTRFYEMICAPTKRPHFFVGNFAKGPQRKSFSVLGMYYPDVNTDYGSTLF
ncbi:hypothetical protein QN367_17380 [Cryobacterium sp. RTS3]|uniref:hypothetical protein n=1 Tax=Cryobacterium sp. RTS3 TaxID=3048643 RepID=UPI002B22EE1A|nr:hypothetical protein [Cryobacterium sp. RTS3]MEB0000848.1 hypothetical protein [Cryobacterium sp. RTS3]